ncbi:hypothetical protein LTR24_007290 [Lithohypha guttulata]|uniref:NADH:ubiquinone oxidoreductase intermediate-associated protein 30 domain-containing protein n=1 Tax=Lithohypha guttulata TaxID=1690604 RepID=A0ABR0K3K9_9EURO|nr:hypothetical protein LTR24_007290 [Lithohypha guttulata]
MNDISSTNPLFGGKLYGRPLIERDHAIFDGHLDINTLGGAGFASQRTTGDDRHWDLTQYAGIELVFDSSGTDEKTYTFILKDELLPPNPENGREQSTVSWEFDFSKKDAHACHDVPRFHHISITWDVFKATYRGKPKADAKPLAKHDVKRMSIMMRSFFGTQKGEFSLALITIRGILPQPSPDTTRLSSTLDGDDDHSICKFDKPTQRGEQQSKQSIWSRFFCWTQL